MSKKITIPKCRNPFVVIVNGIRYEYESEQEYEVPDKVAEVIQFHVDSKPKPKPIDENSGSSVEDVAAAFDEVHTYAREIITGGAV